MGSCMVSSSSWLLLGGYNAVPIAIIVVNGSGGRIPHDNIKHDSIDEIED